MGEVNNVSCSKNVHFIGHLRESYDSMFDLSEERKGDDKWTYETAVLLLQRAVYFVVVVVPPPPPRVLDRDRIGNSRKVFLLLIVC